MSKFSSKNIVRFKLNDIEYALYDHIIKDWAIFNVLMDCEVNDILELKWDISFKNVEAIFSFICEYDFELSNQEHMETCIEIISFMRYIGVREALIQEFVRDMTSGGTIPEYIDQCCKITYDDSMLCVFDVILKNRAEKLGFQNRMFKKICATDFPDEAKIYILRNLIIPRINRLMYENHILIESSCKFMHTCELHDKCKIIKIFVAEIYREYDFDQLTLDVHHDQSFNQIIVAHDNITMINHYPNEKGLLDIPRTILEHIINMMQQDWIKK